VICTNTYLWQRYLIEIFLVMVDVAVSILTTIFQYLEYQCKI